MAPFEPPGLTQAKNRAWSKVAKADFCDSTMLWTDYWTRFNTISIPIQDEDAFFADAMAAARVAENRQHLEEILEQKSRERRAELADIVSSIAIAAISLRTPFDTPTARSAALKVGQTGSLDSFAQLALRIIASSVSHHASHIIRLRRGSDSERLNNITAPRVTHNVES
ncbi:hypothetical protein K4K58_002014 [Colletotrichum sp. SAR11_239]|nr:hypothetical protein K4K58_002014 [Colletotrichum sp. SAR11_239]